MKITNLYQLNQIYTSNVYLLTGDFNALEDMNTLIDVGRDPSILDRIDEAPTGVGKHKIEQVILTHSHFDHANLLPIIKQKYKPTVYAFSKNIEGIDRILFGGEKIRIADKDFEVIHTPGHSGDSICLYCQAESILFAGDTPLVIRTRDNNYDGSFISALEYITTKKIEKIYFGHGEPLIKNCKETILKSLDNVK